MEIARISVQKLEIVCVIGCGEAERASPQRIELDFQLEYDISKATSSDNIEHAVNYFEVCKRLTQECVEKKFHLVEKLAYDCSEMIFNGFPPVRKIKIEVRKIRIIPEALYAGIVLERSRENRN